MEAISILANSVFGGVIGNVIILVVVLWMGVSKVIKFWNKNIVNKEAFNKEIRDLKQQHSESKTLVETLQTEIRKGVHTITKLINDLDKQTREEVAELNTRITVLEEKAK